jgi:radical SAM protein with 4Fe4S-binding SPASM domain
MTGAEEFVLQWHLTERCNLRCAHCYQVGRPADEMSAAELWAVVDEVVEAVAAWGELYGRPLFPAFHLTGGEPLLRSEIHELVAHLRLLGVDAWLLTNGTLVNSSTAARLADSGVNGVQVSLEGPEELHDRIRGPGSFRAALRGAGELVAKGVPTDLNVTLSRLNADHVEELVAIARGLGVERIAFSRLVPWGRGRELFEHMLEPETLREIYARLESLGGDGLRVSTRDPLNTDSGDGCCETTPIGGCAAGLWGITLLPDGTLHPCRRLPVPIGNLRRDSLREVWATSEVLARLRDKGSYSGACGRCERWAACRGCRAVAYACSAVLGSPDFLADDPQCFRQASASQVPALSPSAP